MPVLKIKVSNIIGNSPRLDQYIASVEPAMNRSKLKVTAQAISVNGKTAKFSTKLKTGDEIVVVFEDNIPENIEPENIPLHIIYEDKNVTVINKKQGMVVHPATGNWKGTLVNALLFHWGRDAVCHIKDDSENEPEKRRRPGIVHRLDKDTSGIIITAKNRETEEWLSKQFKDRLLQKEYICIVSGKPPASAGDIKTQIIRDTKNRQKFKAVTATQEGKFARTLYHCIACYGNYSLMRVRIKTGRTHQIRVHMRYIGCPILGDSLYGRPSTDFPNASLMLHSSKLIVKLSEYEKYTKFRSAIPLRFLEVIHSLRKNYQRQEMPKVSPKWKK